MNTLYVREWAADICDVFEKFLDRRDITVPSEDRVLENDPVLPRIYGIDYAELEDNVKDVIIKLAVDLIKGNYKNLNITDYNGGNE